MRRRILLGVLCLAAAIVAPAAWAALDTVGRERVVLRTDYGDMVFALYPEAAPGHVSAILDWVRSGIYDSTAISFIQSGFLIQAAGVSNREQLLTLEQEKKLHSLKGEFSSLRHQRGSLSMAREPDDPDSATTSFCIMLRDSPHLDGKYTVFGRMKSGEAVLKAIEAAPIDDKGRPRKRISILKAVVIDSPEALAALPPINSVYALEKPEQIRFRIALGIGGLLVMLGGVCLAFFGRQSRFGRRSRWAHAIGLLALLPGFIGVLAWMMPGISSPGLSSALFAGTIALFYLMTRFESG